MLSYLYILHIYIFTSFSISYTSFVFSLLFNFICHDVFCFFLLFLSSLPYFSFYDICFSIFCYFIDFLIFILYHYLCFLRSLFGAFLLCKNLGYLLIAFRISSIAEFYIIKLYTCIIYIYYFLFIKPILRIKNRTSFLYSLALSLSLSLTTMQVLSISFFLILYLLSIFYLFVHANFILLILF